MNIFGGFLRRGNKDSWFANSKRSSEVPYKKGDFIGQKYEVHKVLGRGGFGVVYLVYSHENKDVYALKTFRDEYLKDAETRELFRKEASVWADLERHPYLVRAYFAEEVAGRLYIAMEYIAPDEEELNSLECYLARRPPNLAQSLRWSIQFCYGMEYAYSRGIRCHRDIKPANIMISMDKTVKISDFGLAGVLGSARAISGIRLGVQQGRVGLSTMEGKGFGTPTHMPPEQFTNAKDCDERSDIYAFGIVLYQLAMGGELPFLAPLPRDNSEEEMRRFWRAMHRLHSESPVPRLNSPLFPIIQHCLEKEPSKRYQTFKELRAVLEPLLKRQTGEAIKPPKTTELEASELSNKGTTLKNVGRVDEAIATLKRAIELDPSHANAHSNLGLAYYERGWIDQAMAEFKRAIELNPSHVYAHSNLGVAYYSKGWMDQAITEFKRAIELDPSHANAHSNLGNAYARKGWMDQAITEFKRAIELNPSHADPHFNLGNAYKRKGWMDQAITEFKRAIELDPNDADFYYNLGLAYYDKGWMDQAITEFKRAIELDPSYANVHYDLGVAYYSKGWMDQAITEFKRAIELNPNDADAHFNLAVAYYSSRRFDLAWKHVRIAEKLGTPTQKIDQLIAALRKVSREL